MCQSKSILRAVCGQLERDFESVVYFPSYELVLTDENSWEKDARHVSSGKVRDIMTNFIENTLGLDAGDRESEDPKFNFYTSHWAALKQSLTEHLGALDPAGCRKHFNPVLEKMDRDRNAGQNHYALPNPTFGLWDIGKLAQVEDRTPDSLALIQRIFRDKKLNFFKSHTADAQVVIELGAGPGLNLFALAMSHLELRKFKLHAFEYTRAGRELINYLSVRFGISVQTHSFDFNKPASLSSTLQEITGDRPTVILTSYAIAEIPVVQLEVIHALLSIKNLLKVIHVEPVGWQTDEQLSDFDADFKRECVRLSYNVNLVPLLRSCQESALISNLQIVKPAVSHRVTLPGTFVTWEPRTRSGSDPRKNSVKPVPLMQKLPASEREAKLDFFSPEEVANIKSLAEALQKNPLEKEAGEALRNLRLALAEHLLEAKQESLPELFEKDYGVVFDILSGCGTFGLGSLPNEEKFTDAALSYFGNQGGKTLDTNILLIAMLFLKRGEFANWPPTDLLPYWLQRRFRMFLGENTMAPLIATKKTEPQLPAPPLFI